MPTYTYTCPECGWTGDRTASIANRNKQRCHNKVDRGPRAKPGETVMDVLLVDVDCGAKLTKDEIPESQGRCSHNWSKWQR